MMKLIDIHAHIGLNEFDSDRAEVVKRATEKGVIAILDSGETLEENKKVLELSEKFEILKPSFGFSPKMLDMKKAEEVEEFIRENAEKAAAIGEIGLDYWHIKEEREKQKEIFELFINLAKELDKPLVVHSRSAGKYALEVLEKAGAERVCMHAFDGKAGTALKGVELRYYFSIPPSVIRSEQKQKLVKTVPIENLLLESDSPVLGPEKTGRNEPANIIVSAQEIARIKGIDVEEVAQITTKNAKEFLRE